MRLRSSWKKSSMRNFCFSRICDVYRLSLIVGGYGVALRAGKIAAVSINKRLD